MVLLRAPLAVVHDRRLLDIRFVESEKGGTQGPPFFSFFRGFRPHKFFLDAAIAPSGK